MNPDRDEGLYRAISYLAVAATGVIATLVFLILPIMVSAIAQESGWSERQIGWLAAADMGGSAIASLVLAGLITRLNWKYAIRLAIGCVVAGNLVSILADSLIALLLIRVVTGLSNGVIMSIAFAQLCRSPDPDRYFGAYVFLQLGLQAALLPVLPSVIAHWGMGSVYVFLALASLASMALLRFFPAQPAAERPSSSTLQALGSKAEKILPAWQRSRGLLALFAQAVYFLAPAAIWAYSGLIGAGFGLALETAGRALGFATLAGMAGALAVVLLANRFSRNSNMVVGTAISIMAVLLLLQGSGLQGFFLAAALINFSWNFTFPYQMGTLALFDQNGSLAVLALVVQTFGLSAGPLMASLLLVGDDFSRMLWVCGGCYALSLLMFLAVSRGGTMSRAQPDRALT